jgi:hypothetical protein
LSLLSELKKYASESFPIPCIIASYLNRKILKFHLEIHIIYSLISIFLWMKV